MATAALEALRGHARRAHLTALAARPAIELLERDPRVDRRVALQDLGFEHVGVRGSEEVRRRFAEWLAEQRFDAVVDGLHAPAGVREVLDGLPLFRVECDPEAELAALHDGGGAAEAIRRGSAAGWRVEVPDCLQPSLRLDPDDRRAAERHLEEWGLAAKVRRPLALAPRASLRVKRWPPERFARTAAAVARRTGRAVLIFTGPDGDAGEWLRERIVALLGETGAPPALPGSPGSGAAVAGPLPAAVSPGAGSPGAGSPGAGSTGAAASGGGRGSDGAAAIPSGHREDPIPRSGPQAVRVVGRPGLRVEAALLARCAALLANDTGLLHVASAVGTPAVAIFGPTDPRVYRPRYGRAVSVGGVGIRCPHRYPGRLWPPDCWVDDRCRLDGRSCVDHAPVEAAERALLELLEEAL